MDNKIVVISNGPGLEEVRDEFGHSYDWVQSQCNIDDVEFCQYNAYKGVFPNVEDGLGWIITGSAKSTYEDLEWIVELEILIKKAFHGYISSLSRCNEKQEFWFWNSNKKITIF